MGTTGRATRFYGGRASLCGSLLAGLLTSRGRRDFNRAGCLASVLGAMALILAGRLLGVG